jgi:tRNA (cmo5U34)-methyltransferase
MKPARTRVPEPMAMDDPGAVAAFDSAHPVLQAPIYRLNAHALSRLLLDLALGRPDVRIAGLDLAPNMVAAARRAFDEAGVPDRASVERGDMTAVDVVPDRVDVISCVWALHHLPDREHALRCLREIARLRAEHGAAVWIFDFARLRDAAVLQAIMDAVPAVPARLYEDGLASEAAAWTAGEMREMLDADGLGDLTGGCERRIGHLQAWTTGVPDTTAAHERRWRAAELRPQAAEELYRRLSAGLGLVRATRSPPA